MKKRKWNGEENRERRDGERKEYVTEEKERTLERGEERGKRIITESKKEQGKEK